MSDLTMGVVIGTSATDVRRGICGVAIGDGDAIRLNSSTDRLEPAKADSATTATVKGIALHAAGVGQPVAYAQSGPITTTGATVGVVYVLSSAAAGGIAPWADLVSDDIVSVIGVATAATAIEIGLLNSAAIYP